MDFNAEVVEQIIAKLKLLPNRAVASAYFQLGDKILDIAGLKESDPRLITSLPLESRLPISINKRYVLVLKVATSCHFELIFDASWKQHQETIKPIVDYQFSPHSKGEEPPYLLQFDCSDYEINRLLSSPEITKCFSTAIKAEVTRGKSSPYRKYHKPEVYKLFTDQQFREEMLRRVFDSEEQEITLPEEETATYAQRERLLKEGSLKQIYVNAYERNARAREECLKYWGG